MLPSLWIEGGRWEIKLDSHPVAAGGGLSRRETGLEPKWPVDMHNVILTSLATHCLNAYRTALTSLLLVILGDIGPTFGRFLSLFILR